jgi:hypothetical protein
VSRDHFAVNALEDLSLLIRGGMTMLVPRRKLAHSGF